MIPDGFGSGTVTPPGFSRLPNPAHSQSGTNTPTTETQRLEANGVIMPVDGNATPTQCINGGSVTPRSMPAPAEEADFVDLPFDLEAAGYTFACAKLLSGADLDEERFSTRSIPLDGVDGVALTEEAAESGTADMVAQPTPAS